MTSNIQIGKIIEIKMSEKEFRMERLAKQLDIPEQVLSLMLKNDDLGCNVLFRISKILDYDFFSLYSWHLNHVVDPGGGDERNATGMDETSVSS